MNNLAATFRAQGRSEDAIALLRRAIDLAPDLADAHWNLGNALRDTGALDAAAASYRRILEIDPQHAPAHNALGAIHATRGEADLAAACFARAVALDPAHSDAHNNLGNLHQSARAYERAIDHYRRAIDADGRNPGPRVNLGTMLKKLGRRDEAEAAWRAVLGFAPDNADALARLSLLRHEGGDVAAAIAGYCRVLAKTPHDGQTTNMLGLALQEADQASEAIACYRRALEIDPNDAEAHYNLALASKYLPPGADDLARLEENAAQGTDAQVEHAAALWHAGRTAEADATVEAALARDANHAGALTLHALLLQAAGQPQDSLAAVRRALSAAPDDPVVQAAAASLEAAADPARQSGRRIALHMNLAYHYRILRPIFDRIPPPHLPLLTPHVQGLVEFDPDVVIVAESQASLLRARLPRAAYVWVRHGLISKNTTCFAARCADFACMTSEAARDWYADHGGRPRRDFWVTGYVQMDPLFRGDPMALPFDLPAGPTVVYAPTWNAGLSSAPLLGADIARRIRGDRPDVSIVIKPHPVIFDNNPEWVAPWRAAAAAEPGVFLVDDRIADVMPDLQAGDVLISDTSSVIFQFLALDRPIVLINHPDRLASGNYDPNGIEWRWRDVGEEVDDLGNLAAAVSRALDDPERNAERRRHYRQELFGTCTDGQAAARIARLATEVAL